MGGLVLAYLFEVPEDRGSQDLGLVAPGLAGEVGQPLLKARRQRIFEFHDSNMAKRRAVRKSELRYSHDSGNIGRRDRGTRVLRRGLT